MGILNLHRIFNASSIAVIGASDRKGSIGESIMVNLLEGGYGGKVYPVNPRHRKIMGLTAYPHVDGINRDVDLAVIAIPMAMVPDIVADCGKAGLAGCVVIPAWDRENGETPARIEASILAAGKISGIRIFGPNSIGIANTGNFLNASLAPKLPLPGKIAFLSQSGAVCASVLDFALGENVGFSHLVTLGSMADVDFADMIDYLGGVKEVESILMYVESLTNIRNFMSAARAVSRVKPIIVLKSGKSVAGARASAFHRGSMAGNDAIYDAAFKRAGILRVRDFQELFDCAKFLSRQPRPKGPRLAILTNAGAPGVMAADALDAYGVEPAILSNDTISRLDAILPLGWSHQNPVEMIGDTLPGKYIEAAKICIDAPETDGLLLIFSSAGSFDDSFVAKTLAEFLTRTPCPVFTAWTGWSNMDKARAIFNDAGVITYDSPERGVRAFMNLYQYGKNLDMLHEIPIRRDKKLLIDKKKAAAIIAQGLAEPGLLTGVEAKELLFSYGIPVNPCGLAKTGDIDYELIIGVKQDDSFGPVVFFGMGGEMSEVFRDTAMGLPPLNHPLAGAIMRSTRISRVIEGFGNITPVNRSFLEEILIRLGRLVTDFPEICEIDINPVIVSQGNVMALDARVVLKPSTKVSPMHLVISSYPWEEEAEDLTVTDEVIHIRPIRPEDAGLMIEHFNALSPKSIYQRFFFPMKQLSKWQLIRLTQIDYDREVALIALVDTPSGEKMVGVARVIDEPGVKTGEFAVIVSDEWQGKGIGASLLKRCLRIAKQKGLDTVWGLVIAENIQMLKLGKKLGFGIKRISGSSEYELRIDLTTFNEGGIGHGE